MHCILHYRLRRYTVGKILLSFELMMHCVSTYSGSTIKSTDIARTIDELLSFLCVSVVVDVVDDMCLNFESRKAEERNWQMVNVNLHSFEEIKTPKKPCNVRCHHLHYWCRFSCHSMCLVLQWEAMLVDSFHQQHHVCLCRQQALKLHLHMLLQTIWCLHPHPWRSKVFELLQVPCCPVNSAHLVAPNQITGSEQPISSVVLTKLLLLQESSEVWAALVKDIRQINACLNKVSTYHSWQVTYSPWSQTPWIIERCRSESWSCLNSVDNLRLRWTGWDAHKLITTIGRHWNRPQKRIAILQMDF